MSHHVPVKESEVGRVRTGYERVIAHQVSSKYAYVAKQDGKVIKVDDSIKMIRVKYKDGVEEVLQYGEDYGYTSDMYITQDIRPAVKNNQTFKKGEVLVYNSGFFKLDSSGKHADWMLGTYANVALMDVGGTFEDSSIISREFGKKLQMKPVYERTVVFEKDDIVVSCLGEGDKVNVNSRLIVLEDSDVATFTMDGLSEDTEEFLVGLNRQAPKSRYSGEIVGMKAFYGSPLSDMNTSVANVIRKINTNRNKKATFSSGSKNEMSFNKPVPLPRNTRYKGITFDKDTVVLQFLIQEKVDAGIGDKLVFGAALKSIIAEVLVEDVVSGDGTKIDVIFGGSSISNRIVLSPFLIGLYEIVLQKLEERIIEIIEE